MNVIKVLILLMVLPSIAIGQVKYVEKGEVTPYTGYLFTEQAELDNRLKLIDHSINTQQLDLYIKNEELWVSQVNLWKTQSQDLSKELVKKEQNQFWYNTLYFALGAIVTTGLAFGVSRATR